jgi:hypothetical protein
VRGELVLKLPGGRVDALVAAGDGERFDAGKDKPMREWFVLSITSRKSWLALAKEAMAFVSAGRGRGAPSARRAQGASSAGRAQGAPLVIR